MDKEVIREKPSDAQACIDTGALIGMAKVNPQPHGRSFAVVPAGTKLEYLEAPAFPPRRTGTVKLADASSFLAYWKRQSDPASYIYGSMQPAQFLAVFNEHGKATSTDRSGADWRDHRALYQLAHSDEWMTWTKRSGQTFDGNEAFAFWLEENLFDISMPDPAKFMDIALNIRVKQGQVFGNKVNLNDGNIVLEYANQVDASAGAGGKLAIPEKFQINIPVFKGLDAPRWKIDARFRYRLTGGNLTLRYDLVRPAKVMEAAFKDMLAEIQKAAKTVVLFGLPD